MLDCELSCSFLQDSGAEKFKKPSLCVKTNFIIFIYVVCVFFEMLKIYRSINNVIKRKKTEIKLSRVYSLQYLANFYVNFYSSSIPLIMNFSLPFFFTPTIEYPIEVPTIFHNLNILPTKLFQDSLNSASEGKSISLPGFNQA